MTAAEISRRPGHFHCAGRMRTCRLSRPRLSKNAAVGTESMGPRSRISWAVAFGDERAAQAEALGVGHAVIALVRRAEAGVFLSDISSSRISPRRRCSRPAAAPWPSIYFVVEWVTISAPQSDGLAVDGGGKGVIHNQGHAVGVGRVCKFFNIQDRQRRVGDGLTEEELRIGPEGGVQLLGGCSRGRRR